MVNEYGIEERKDVGSDSQQTNSGSNIGLSK